MICVTGDIHGDMLRFANKKIRRLKKNDYLIVCGDFGFIWNGSKREQRILKRLGQKKYNILFVDGCHENFNLLNAYEEQTWNGGKVRVISGKLMQLMRGQVFKIGDTKIYTFGGGQSDDMDIRREFKTWWKVETPNEDEINYGKTNLTKHDNIVDYIISHEPPPSIREFMLLDTVAQGQRRQVNAGQKSEMGAYFDELKDTCRFKRWFFGKHHKNKIISSQFASVFDEVIILNK